MDNILQSIFSIPIVGDLIIGVLGGIIVIIVQYLFLSFILPIYRGKSQQLPNFDNSYWLGYSDEVGLASKAHSKLTIHQIGNKINAEVTRIVKNGERKFKYTGSIYGGQIVLEFFDEQGPGLIVGTMVLHIGSDLRTLRGASTYFHHDKGRVVSTFRTYRRQEKPPVQRGGEYVSCDLSSAIDTGLGDVQKFQSLHAYLEVSLFLPLRSLQAQRHCSAVMKCCRPTRSTELPPTSPPAASAT